MSDENVPLDARAVRAEAVVKAALEWAAITEGAWSLSREEWRLLEAVEVYGGKGLRGR